MLLTNPGALRDPEPYPEKKKGTSQVTLVTET